METFQTEPETEILTCPKSESSKRQEISQTLQNSIHVEKMEMFNMRYKHFFTLRLHSSLDFSLLNLEKSAEVIHALVQSHEVEKDILHHQGVVSAN